MSPKYHSGAEHELVASWLAKFGDALSAGSAERLQALFIEDADWRDVMSFTWDMRTHLSSGRVAAELVRAAAGAQAHDFKISEQRTAPQQVVRAGDQVIEAFFNFQTRIGRGEGILRLDKADGHFSKARTLLTSLRELTGHEEAIGPRRPQNTAYSRTFGGKNWLDLRNEAQRYEGKSPEVLIVGAGQAGLSIGARLRALGVDALIIDKHERVGDVWRKRYHSLTLHNQVWVAHFPYLPFPPTWPTYIPKDKLANWMEAYVDIMELNVWTSTEFVGGVYDDAHQRWKVTVRHDDGRERTFEPRHVVMATGGVSGIPNIPKLPGLENFRGDVLHSSRYTSGLQFSKRKALVIGTGTSGHDVAQDLHALGSEAVLVQRQPTTVVSLEHANREVYGLYAQDLPTEDVDLIAMANSYTTMIRHNQIVTRKLLELDKELLDRLHRVGFQTDIGEDETGFHLKYNRRGGGYYINVGASDLIANGEIGLLQADRIAEFVSDGVLLKDGVRRPCDLVVLATGYRNQQEEIAVMFGTEVAQKVGPIWGVDDGGEMRNMWKPTAQQGLWFHAGSLLACRYNSTYLALQIKAALVGLHPKYSA